MKNTTNNKNIRVRGLEIEVDFSWGDTTCPHLNSPEALLIDRSGRLFLADVQEERDGGKTFLWILRHGRRRQGGKRWKLASQVRVGDLQEVSLPHALLWYADHCEAYDGYCGDARRLARLAAKAMAE